MTIDEIVKEEEFSDAERGLSMMLTAEQLTCLIKALRYDIDENDSGKNTKKQSLLRTIIKALNYKSHG